MLRRQPAARPRTLPVVLLLLCTLLLSATPAAAQATDPDVWREGDPVVTDNFSRNTGQWTLDTGGDAVRSISRSRLVVSVPEEELFRWSTLDLADPFKDFLVEVDVIHMAGPVDAMAGIIFRYLDVDNFYAFLVSPDGWYALLAYVDGELERPVDWAESDVLDVGEGSRNTLAVLANGREIRLYANDEELDRVQDRSFTEGQIALVAGTNAEGGLDIGFDNFSLWNKPGASSGTNTGRKGLRLPTPAAPERPANAADAVVATDTLNVRSGPGTNYPVVGALKRGDGVRIIGRSADSRWAKLGFTDVTEAWASVQYLTMNINFGGVAVAQAPAPPPTPRPAANPQQPARTNVAWLVIENHIGRHITVQVNDKNFRVEGKVGNTPGRYQFELQGVGWYKVAAQLPNAGGHNWDLYVEPTADKCVNRQGCVALGQTFLQTYY
jgi:hypothetical protein